MSIRSLAVTSAAAVALAGLAVPGISQSAPLTPTVRAEVAAGAPAGIKVEFFKTPSENIRCGMFKSGGKWSMRCDVYEHSWVAPGPDPCGGTGDYGSSVGMGSKNRPKFLCVSDAMDNGRTLTYGSTLTYGPFFCRSRPKGLKCYNGRGHGWFLSKESYRFF